MRQLCPRQRLPRRTFALGALVASLLSSGCGHPASQCAAAAAAPGKSNAPAVAPTAARGPGACLSIGAWNDLHGQILPANLEVDTGPIALGGVVALADEVDRLRASGDAVVLLDAGDLFTGPLASTLSEGAPIIEAYRVLGLDAATIGNHEFDFGPVGLDAVIAAPGATDADGPSGPRGALMARMQAASFPFVAANIHLENGERPAWPKFRPSVLLHRDGFDVGVVGYATEGTKLTTLRTNVADLDFSKDGATSVAREIRDLRSHGARPVVLLAHASLEGELPEQLDDAFDPRGEKHEGELASLVRALGPDRPDVIVAGHRHAWMLGRIDGIPVVSSSQHGTGLAQIRFCRRGEDVRFDSIERRVVVASTPPRTDLGKRVAEVIAPWLARAKAIGETPVATLKTTCENQSANGTAMLEQMARALAEHVTDAKTPPPGVPIVAMTNAGGARVPLNAGAVTYADLFAAFPFESTVSVCATTQKGFRTILERALAARATRSTFPFAIAGAHADVVRRPDHTLTLERLVVEGTRGDRAKSIDAPVWLALPDFLLDGGDGYVTPESCTSTARSSTRLRDAWRDVLRREGTCDGPMKNVSVRARP